jgi:hypothetical protein
VGRHRTGDIVPAEAGRVTRLIAITTFGQPVSYTTTLTITEIEKSCYAAVVGGTPRFAS